MTVMRHNKVIKLNERVIEMKKYFARKEDAVKVAEERRETVFDLLGFKKRRKRKKLSELSERILARRYFVGHYIQWLNLR